MVVMLTLFVSVLVGVLGGRYRPQATLIAVAIVFVIWPVGYMSYPDWFGRFFTPSVMLLAGWAAGVLTRPHSATTRTSQGALSLALFLIALFAIGSAAISTDPARSWAWTGVMVILFFLAPLIAQTSNEDLSSSINWGFAIIAVVLGAFAGLEAVAGVNPWHALYSDAVLRREWSVTRVLASVGHPLNVGAIASAAFVYCALSVPRSRWNILPAAAAAVALTFAVARSGVIAAGLGLAAGLLLSVRGASGRQRGTILVVLLLGGAGLWAVANSALFVARSNSAEGTVSSQVRETVSDRAAELISGPWLLGVGPGQGAAEFYDRFGAAFENSSLQLLLGVGFLGASVFVLYLAVFMLRSIRATVFAPVGALIAFLVAVSSYNALDQNPGLFVVASLCLIEAAQRGAQPRPTESVDDRSTPASRNGHEPAHREHQSRRVPLRP